MFLNKIRNIFCVRNKCCARRQTGKHLCQQQCVRNNVSSFARALTHKLRACLHGGGGPQVGEVTRLAVVEKWLAFTCKLTTPGSWGDVTKSCYVQLGMSTEKMAADQRILTACVLFLSLSALAATFQCRGFLLLLLMNLARFGELANVT